MTRLAGAALLLLACLGCGGGSSATVSGAVTLDGQPVKQGTVRFVPADGKSPPVDAAIRDGKYSAAVPPGDAKVEITAPVVVGKRKAYDTDDSPMVEEVKESLPARYNTQTELKFAVQKGSQEKNWELSK
jgi:hypothetical protein